MSRHPAKWVSFAKTPWPLEIEGHALLRRSQIPMAILLETMRPERVSQKVKPLLLRLHQLRLLPVQGQPEG